MIPEQYGRTMQSLWEELYWSETGGVEEGRILDLGIDIMDVGRFRGPRGESTASSILTEIEWEFCRYTGDPPREWAALWAAREATYKASSGLLSILPQSWRMERLGDGRWRPRPKVASPSFDAFMKRHHIEVKAKADEEHAVALAVLWMRMDPL